MNINKDGMSHKQKVYIENLLAERIDNIEGIIKFFFGITIVVIVAFSIVFGWFPINEVKAWIGFFCFFSDLYGHQYDNYQSERKRRK